MSIKFKLLLSYIAMLLIPLVLSTAAAYIITASGIGGMKAFGGRGEDKKLLQESARIFSDIKQIASNDPDRLKNFGYLTELDQNLAVINTGIIIRDSDAIVYESRLFEGKDLTKELPQFGMRSEDRHDPKLVDNKLLSIKQHDFYFADKHQGTIFLITDLSPIGQSAKRFMNVMVIIILLTLILTNGVLTYLVSRSIVKPLKALKEAAEQIKEGNLNFEVKVRTKDEIGELAGAFEEMRGQLKYSIDQQIQYENNRKELISNISHDLKTPITAVKGYIEGIMDGVADSEDKMDRYIKTIYAKSNDMDKLIDELFLFSKLDLKKLPFSFEQVDIKKYLDDCVEEMQFDMEKRGISLSFYTDINDVVMVVADREKLKRVIINILENAVKYMDKKDGKIEVYVGETENETLVKIEDNGQGIQKDALPFIFERFYRGDPSRNTSTGGSGLGLAIAKRIIEEHGGRIWAESIEGLGTSIFFTLKNV